MDNIINDKYIYVKENSLSVDICKDVIDIFNNDNVNRRYGVVRDGLKKSVKDTIDCTITINDPQWANIFHLLVNELNIQFKQYLAKIDTEKYKHLNSSNYTRGTCFQMQKYEKNKGKFTYHVDSAYDLNVKEARVVVYMWYLNDVEVGGETELTDYIIKPAAGKLVMFPALWTYPHCGKMPISDDKYIITGWIVQDI
jgi:prolyl 4-hydroxylase